MPSQPPGLGLDFGTTNTALGFADPQGTIELLPLPDGQGGFTNTWRTVLFFEEGQPPAAGAPAIQRFVDTEGEGRLVQSIKSHLASASFKRTFIMGRPLTLEDLIAQYLRALRAGAPQPLGSRVVVGRPVRYWGAEDEADESRALARMQAALAAAGFDEAVFEFEPVAAAKRYAARLDHEELIVVADFGGGTSDFSLLRVGPGATHDPKSALLGTAGLGLGGDSFDARLIDAAVSPELGLGTSYRDEFGRPTPVPAALFGKLRRWHYLSFLKEPTTLRLLDRIEQGTDVPQKIQRLQSLVRDELGLPLHRAVERTKVSLSSSPEASFHFPSIDLTVPLRRIDFDNWISPELDAIDGALAAMLERAGVAAKDVDAVFATGGSSLVPAVRQTLAARFGAEKLMGGEELTSVAWGLAACARQVFG